MVVSERGMSAPPEVVFNTATDPDRLAAWLPAPLRLNGNHPAVETGDLHARWSSPESEGWSAEFAVRQIGAGAAVARLELAADVPDHLLHEIADQALANLARYVADNLTAG